MTNPKKRTTDPLKQIEARRRSEETMLRKALKETEGKIAELELRRDLIRSLLPRSSEPVTAQPLATSGALIVVTCADCDSSVTLPLAKNECPHCGATPFESLR